jgi:hypothetical protein
MSNLDHDVPKNVVTMDYFGVTLVKGYRFDVFFTVTNPKKSRPVQTSDRPPV